MCIITAHAIFISSTIKYNIMNSDSKLKRYIVLLDKAPFVLFLESAKDIPNTGYFVPALKTFNLSLIDVITITQIKPEQDLRKIISATNGLSDPLAYNIIDKLSNSIGYSQGVYFHVEPCFKSAKWQEHVEWQNVDSAPETAKDIVIAVCELTHDLLIFNSEKPVNLDCDGQIVLACLDRSAPFPQALLKECTIEIHDIIIQMSANRITADKAKSKYLSVIQTGHLSVTQTGHDSFNYINLRQIEKDLKDTLAIFNIAVENTIIA